MPKPPRKPREIKRAPDVADATLRSKVVVSRRDSRQPDLFATSFIEPCKPTLSERVPAGDLWQYEIKHDGYRAQCHVHRGHVRIFTRRGHEWSDRMPGIRAALEALDVESMILDGEAVMVGSSPGSAETGGFGRTRRRRSPPPEPSSTPPPSCYSFADWDASHDFRDGL